MLASRVCKVQQIVKLHIKIFEITFASHKGRSNHDINIIKSIRESKSKSSSKVMVEKSISINETSFFLV